MLRGKYLVWKDAAGNVNISWNDPQHLVSRHGINDQHYNILRILRGRQPESACPGEIKEVLLNKRGDLTRLLDKLVNKGWVDRQQNPENRRKIDLKITKEGLKFLEDIHKEVECLMEVTSGLNKEEVESLNLILDKIRS